MAWPLPSAARPLRRLRFALSLVPPPLPSPTPGTDVDVGLLALSEARDSFGHPDEDDWDNAKKMAQFLQHFHDLTVRISSSLQVTCNTFFHEIGEVHLLIQEWLNSEDNLQVSMGMRMKEKFDKYWGL
ncbi:unnamed protein product [Miscanthus lutarioriparius]|uniref:hAT-like transposase RNase-H fold domain-containing protein n=1 Tax=Miscanthus lutarioriparius TaxID=422564 RepID=A0A811NJU4_9POAL|nr:unnamed protein product [Miscanthus lutarioriparius]